MRIMGKAKHVAPIVDEKNVHHKSAAECERYDHKIGQE